MPELKWFNVFAVRRDGNERMLGSLQAAGHVHALTLAARKRWSMPPGAGDKIVVKEMPATNATPAER